MKIFIGSSRGAVPQAEELAGRLGENLEIVPWYEKKTFRPGENVLESLRRSCRECDFAAVLLTPDDKTVRREEEVILPRDNCIFEAGMFLGYFPDPKRVFLVTSIADEDLPSDLHGINTLDPARGMWWVAQQITTQVKALEAYYPPDPDIIPISYDGLLEREASLAGDQRVVVQSGQPIELERTQREKDVRGVIPDKVRQNMSRDVFYHYFFYADPAKADTVAQLCRRLATFSKEGPKLTSAEIKQNLQLMSKHLRIHFLPTQPLIDFCIHDLLSERPLFYLRNRDRERFYLWSDGTTAQRYARNVREAVQDAWQQPAIFASTSLFDLNAAANAAYKARLRGSCLAFFDNDCMDDAARLFFG